MKKLLILSCFLVLPVFAQEYQELANDPQWHRLLHYRSPLFSLGKSSEIHGDFFLSQSPSWNPHLELKATIKAFNNPTKQGTIAACRFPARYQWLRSKGVITEKKSLYCDELEAFKRTGQDLSLSLLFASGFLGNPASMYGHLLLKVNRPYDPASDLLADTINFGAEIPPNESMLAYIALGILGGYASSFTVDQFHQHEHIYNETEMRDIIEYQLLFSDDQVDFILNHLWELNQAKFTYYFFRQNCGYYFANLLALAVEQDLVRPHRPWVLPVDVLEGFNDGNLNYSKIIKHNSRQSRFQNKYLQLTLSERYLLKQWIADKGEPNLWSSVEIFSQERIIDTALDYIAFQQRSDLKDVERKLLIGRFALPTGRVNWVSNDSFFPHQAQKPAYLSLGVSNKNSHTSTQLGFRAANFDLLNIGPSQQIGNQLVMGEVNLSITNARANLDKLTLFDIKRYTAPITDIETSRENAWHVKTHFESLSRENNALAGVTEGGYGKSMQTSPNTVFYALGLVRARYPALQNDYLFAGVGSGLLLVNNNFGVNLELVTVSPIFTFLDWTTEAKAEGVWRLNREQEVRLGISYEEHWQIGMNIRQYF